jgi:glutathione S-transferase
MEDPMGKNDADKAKAELERWKSAYAALAEEATGLKTELTEERVLREPLMAAAEQFQAERDRLREAIASALTSLATGPGKDGYAYQILDAALAALEERDVTDALEAKPCDR